MRKGRCKYWNGAFHNACCDAGVRYNSVVTRPTEPKGIAFRYPCQRVWPTELSPEQMKEFNDKGTCPKYTEPTEDDFARDQADADRLVSMIAKCAPLFDQVRKDHKGESWAGVVACPVCGGTRLHLRHAPNKHIWARCETKDCIAWVQ